jgi:hypothetical protein
MGGGDGVIQHIAEHFGLEVKERQRVRRVLRSITEYSERGATVAGRKPMIYSPQEYQILIDSAEKGYGLVTVIHQINEYREEEHLPDVRFSTVCRTMNRLRPVIRRVKRRKQGYRIHGSPWEKARLRWVTQLLARLGEHVFDHTSKENEYLSLTKTPTYFNTELLPPLSVPQIVFFYECHKKTEIGRTGDTVYTFPKNETGLYYKDGGIGEVDKKLHFKYTKEGRFCFGVSAVELSNGTIDGRRCETFDYSAKKFITITAEEKMIAEEIKRVTGLKSDGQWVEKRIHLP